MEKDYIEMTPSNNSKNLINLKHQFNLKLLIIMKSTRTSVGT